MGKTKRRRRWFGTFLGKFEGEISIFFLSPFWVHCGPVGTNLIWDFAKGLNNTAFGSCLRPPLHTIYSTAVEKRRHLPFPSTFERKCWWYAKKRNIVQCTRVHYITYCIFIKKNLINSHFHQITFQIHNKTYEIRLFLSLIHSHKKRWKVSLWRLCSAFFKFNSFGNAGDRPSVSPLPCGGYSFS